MLQDLISNLWKGKVASAIGLVTLLCETTGIRDTFPILAPACEIVASVSLLFAKFK